MKHQTIRVMNVKTGKVFDITQTAMDTLKKNKLFHNYMIVNPKPDVKSNEITIESFSNRIITIPQPTKENETKETETTKSEFPGFTNFVESVSGTQIEMDNEKPKRKYQKQPK